MDPIKPSLSPRRRKTREAILKASRKIVRTEGIDGLSLRKVAGRIGYTATAIYEYFPSKQALVGELCAQADRRLADYLAAVSESLPIDAQLVELGMAYLRFAVDNPEEFLILFSTPNPPREGPPPQEREGSFSYLHQAVRAGIASGVFDPGDLDPFSVSYAAWAFVHGMATLRLTALRGQPIDFDPVNRWALERFVQGITR